MSDASSDSRAIARREFLATAALGMAGLALGTAGCATRPGSAVARAGGSTQPSGQSPAGHSLSDDALKLGIASYSLRHFPRQQMIEMVKALDTPYINVKSFHLPYELSPAEIAAARQEIERAGLTIVGGGTITFEKDTDDDVRRYFDYAKAAGMPLIVVTMHPAILPRVERFAKSYDIKVAIHNHGPEDEHFPSPYDALKAVKTMDPRMGLCVDIGHTVRTGTDVVQAVADAGPRLLDMHAKDLRDLKDKESQCIVGQGQIPIPALFRQLIAMRYGGYVNLEYEIDETDPLPGMKQSMSYMRGVLRSAAGSR